MVLLAFAGSLAVYLLVRAVIVTDTKRVARLVERGRSGVVHHDLAQVMSCVDQSYDDDFGMDYERLHRWFQHEFAMYDSFVCVIPRLSINVYHREAVCSLMVWFAGYNRGRKAAPAEEGVLEGFPLYSDRLVIYANRFPEGWLITGAGP